MYFEGKNDMRHNENMFLRETSLCFAAVIMFSASLPQPHVSAAIVDLSPVVDGTATDSDRNGTFDSLDRNGVLLTVDIENAFANQSESQASLEFDLSSIDSSATINSASLRLFSRSGGTGGNGNTVEVSVHGYVGDGVLSLANDFDLDNRVSGPFVAPSGINADVTAFVQNLVSSPNTFAGFNLAADTVPFGSYTQNWDSNNAFSGIVSRPLLTIDFDVVSVPEPSTFGMMSLAIGCVMSRRRQRSVRVSAPARKG
jgi:hypothetical protein